MLHFMKQENVAMVEEHSENKNIWILREKEKGSKVRRKTRKERRKTEGKVKKGETTKAKSS